MRTGTPLLHRRPPVAVLARSAALVPPPPSLSLLRLAVAAVFALDGAVFGSWAARIPDVADRVGAGHGSLGVALLCLSVGALAAMQITGALCARLGAGLTATTAALLLCVTTALPGLATSVPQLCAALLAFGAATGAVNVAVNAVGVEVEERLRRPLLSTLHAGFSFGGLLGALAGGLVATVAGVTVHLVAVGAVGLLVTASAGRALVGADGHRSAIRARPAERAERRPTAVLVVLGAVAGCTAFGEGALSDWGALHLRADLAAAPGVAAAGYAGFSLAMACGRLAGAWLVARWGDRRLLAGGAALAAVGGTTAVVTASVPVALAGFVLVGLGLANVFPLSISRAGVLGGARGIALATTVGYTGLLAGPPLIGLLAERAGLPVALGTVPVLALVAGALVLSLVGDSVRLPIAPRAVVSGFGHGTAVYVRDLRALVPGA